METVRKNISATSSCQDDQMNNYKITDDQLLKHSTMFLYLFSKPRNEELSLVPVWKRFYEDLFPPRIILQALANIIKHELKTRRNKESIAENPFAA